MLELCTCWFLQIPLILLIYSVKSLRMNMSIAELPIFLDKHSRFFFLLETMCICVYILLHMVKPSSTLNIVKRIARSQERGTEHVNRYCQMALPMSLSVSPVSSQLAAIAKERTSHTQVHSHYLPLHFRSFLWYLMFEMYLPSY